MYDVRPRRQGPNLAGTMHGQRKRLPDHLPRFVEGARNALSQGRRSLPGRYPKSQRELPIYHWSNNRRYDMFEMIAAYPVLRLASESVRRNGETPGLDEETYYTRIQAPGLDDFLKDVKRSIKRGRYKFQPLKRIAIPKDSGGRRFIDIPTIRDRVVETAMAMMLDSWSSPNWSEFSMGYRPGITLQQVLKRAESLTLHNRTHWLITDIEDAFGSIPHQALLDVVNKEIPHPQLPELIEKWLNRKGWKNARGQTKRGIPQGSPLSPYMLNLFLDKVLDQSLKKGEIPFIRYADDLLFPCRTHDEALERRNWLKQQLQPWGLKVKEEKSTIGDIQQESLCYLGFLVKADGRSLKLDIDPEQHLIRLNREITRRATLNPASDTREFSVKRLDQTSQAKMVIEGWLQHYAQGISNGRLQQVIKEIKSTTIQLQIRGITSEWIKEMWNRYRQTLPDEPKDQIRGSNQNSNKNVPGNRSSRIVSSTTSIPRLGTRTGIDTREEHRDSDLDISKETFNPGDSLTFTQRETSETEGEEMESHKGHTETLPRETNKSLTINPMETPVKKDYGDRNESTGNDHGTISLDLGSGMTPAYAGIESDTESNMKFSPRDISDNAASGHSENKMAQHAVLWSFDGSEELPDPVQRIDPSTPRRPGPSDQDWAIIIG